MTIGEFVDAYLTDNGGLQARFAIMVDLFDEFDPRSRPILWRVLIAYATLCQKLIQTRMSEGQWIGDSFQTLDMTTPENRKRLDWRSAGEQVPDEHVLREPFAGAERYVEKVVGDRKAV